MHIIKSKKLVWKGYILYDSNHMTFGKGKIMKTVKRSVVGRYWRKEGRISAVQRLFRGVKILCMIHVIIYFSKPKECAIPRENPKVNYGLGVVMCQFKFISVYKSIVWEQRVHRKSLLTFSILP